MRRLLLINPNTSSGVTALLHHHVQAALPGTTVKGVTARFGAPYIADEASFAVAGHATLDAWAAALASQETPPDAVLIGCFGDPALLALRQASPVPVSGLAEAAMAQASRHGRFAIVTGGARWQPMLERLAWSLGHAPALAGIQTVEPTGAELAAHPAAAHHLLAQACQACVSQWNAQAIIIGGAGLAGMATTLQTQIGVPLIDSVLAGAQEVWHAPRPARAEAGFDVPWTALPDEMLALGSAQ